MTLKSIIASSVLLVMSYFLKQGLEKALCEINSFACFLGLVAYTLPTIIVVSYWLYKAYPYIESHLN